MTYKQKKWLHGLVSGFIGGAVTAIDTTLILGARGRYQEFMEGAIDDVRIYDRALSAAEIQAITVETFIGTTVSPVPGASSPNGRRR